MRKSLLMIGLLLAMLSGCGGSGGGTPAQTAPSISNFRYSPDAVYLNSGNGATAVSGSFDFADPDGNLATITITVQDSLGRQLETSTSSIIDSAGETAGTIMIAGEVDTTVIGLYTFRIWVTDTSGFVSNTLTGTFRVSDLAWQTKRAMPTPRSGFTVAALNGQLFTIGGEGYDFSGYIFDPLATVEVYDPATDVWSPRAPLLTPRKGAAVAVLNGIIYVIGGKNLSAPGGLGTVEAYDPVTNSWSSRAPLSTPRRFATASVVNGIIYVIGGDGGAIDLASVEAYDPVTDNWSTKAPMPTPRRDLTSAVVNGRIYAIGGYGSTSLTGYQSIVEQYDPATDSWSTSSSMPYGAQNLAAAAVNGRIYVAGGNNALNRAIDTLIAYDPASDTWKQKTSMPAGLSQVAADVANGQFYAIGGLVTYEYTAANDIL